MKPTLRIQLAMKYISFDHVALVCPHCLQHCEDGDGPNETVIWGEWVLTMNMEQIHSSQAEGYLRADVARPENEPMWGQREIRDGSDPKR